MKESKQTEFSFDSDSKTEESDQKGASDLVKTTEDTKGHVSFDEGMKILRETMERERREKALEEERREWKQNREDSNPRFGHHGRG